MYIYILYDGLLLGVSKSPQRDHQKCKASKVLLKKVGNGKETYCMAITSTFLPSKRAFVYYLSLIELNSV